MSNDDANFHEGRIRRTFQLTNYCIANIAAYRVNWQSENNVRHQRVDSDFWMRANSAFFDMAVIEWCKLFSDNNGKHHWSLTFPKKQEWKNLLLRHMQLDEDAYDFELHKIRSYRNSYVAHLDEPKSMTYPLTEFMLKSSEFLYDSIKTSEHTKRSIGAVYESANTYYLRLMNEYNNEIEFRLNH